MRIRARLVARMFLVPAVASSLLLVGGLAAGADQPTSVAGAKEPPRVLILDIITKVGLDPAIAELFTELLQKEMRSRNLEVIAQADVRTMLGVEELKQLVTCSDASCLAELGGSLGVEEIVHGSIGIVGDLMVVTVKRTSQTKAAVLAQAVRTLSGAEAQDVFAVVAPIATELYGPAIRGKADSAATTSVSSTSNASGAWPWVLIGSGGAAVAFGAIATALAFGAADEYNSGVRAARGRNEAFWSAALVSYGAGLAAIGTGVAWKLLSGGGDVQPATAAITALPDGSGAIMSVRGTW